MNKKGFTLVELLAVIVILAIVALILVPMTINMINDSKEGAQEINVDLYKKAAEQSIVAAQIKNKELTFNNCVIDNTELTCDGTLIQVKVDGTKPESGSIVFQNGKAIYWNLQGNGYDYSWVDDNYAFSGNIKGGAQVGSTSIVSNTPINTPGYAFSESYCEISFDQEYINWNGTAGTINISSYYNTNYETVEITPEICNNSLPSTLNSNWGTMYETTNECTDTSYNGYMGCLSGIHGTYKYVYEPAGVASQETSEGTTYYYVGNVDNNYIKFGGQYPFEYGDNRWKSLGYDSYNECTSNIVSDRQAFTEGGCNLGYNDDNGNYVDHSKSAEWGSDPETGEWKVINPISLDDQECLSWVEEYAENECKDLSYTETKDMIWKIVRVNEDGSIRLVLTEPIDISAFNKGDSSGVLKKPKYVGYMYGTDSDPYSNKYDSTVKTVLDNFYRTYLLDDASNIADSGFCNDRTILSQEGNYVQFGTAEGFECPNAKRDLFTVNNSKGNKKLTYPIGLLTKADDIDNAFDTYVSNTKGWDREWWSMTPVAVYNTFFGMNDDFWIPEVYPQSYSSVGVDSVYWVYPSINLKASTMYKSGSGTLADPYIVN